MNLTHRIAKLSDLKTIVSLLFDDPLGQLRERSYDEISHAYMDAFAKIDSDPNQYLMVVERDGITVGTCHATLMPSLTFSGSTRLHIEAVRVHDDARGQNIGQKMIEFAIQWGTDHGATIVQLTTNKERPDALRFYERLGFKATHVGLKLYLESQ